VQGTIHQIAVPVLDAAPQPDFAGLDQVNVFVTLQLRGLGPANAVLTADGQTSHTVTLSIQ